MNSIDRENEFTKVSWEEDMILTQVKSRFLKFGFNYYAGTKVFSAEPLETAIPVSSIKKMKIQGPTPVIVIFLIFAALIFGLGFLNGHDPITGESTGPSNSAITICSIIALAFVGLAFLFMRSKVGKLNYLFTTYQGTHFVIYGSLDKQELIILREDINKMILRK